MVSVPDPVVLLPLAWAAVLSAAGFRYRWGSLPPVRALAVFSVALFWLAYSLTQLSVLLATPLDDAPAVAAMGSLAAGGALPAGGGGEAAMTPVVGAQTAGDQRDACCPRVVGNPPESGRCLTHGGPIQVGSRLPHRRDF